MTIEKQAAAEPIREQPELIPDCAMVRPMGIVQPSLEFRATDRALPQMAVRSSPRRNDPKPASRSRTGSHPIFDMYDCRVDLIFRAVAVHGRSGSPRDNCRSTASKGAPDEPVD